MPIRIAINGYGRIGRCVLRALYQSELSDEIKIVAVNDLGLAKVNSHLTKYDTTHGIFKAKVSFDEQDNIIKINDDQIHMLSEKDPSMLPWKDLKVDIVFECTGFFTAKEKALQHIKAGANKVIISAPSNDVDSTIVFGVNHDILSPEMKVISNASCTTNCLAPLAKILNSNIGIEKGLMTTIHAYTNDQALVDTYHEDVRRARAASHNMIPTKTGAANAVGLVLPELKGCLDGFAIRVPTINVSVVDFTFTVKTDTSIHQVNKMMKDAAQYELKDILFYNDQPLVSSDFNGNTYPSIFDATQTRVSGRLVKVLSWYDNEWGFSNQMIKTARYWCNL